MKIFLNIIICVLLLIGNSEAAEDTSDDQKLFEAICLKCKLDCVKKYEKDQLVKVDDLETLKYLAIFFDYEAIGSQNRNFFVYLFDGSSCRSVLKGAGANAEFYDTATYPRISSYWHVRAEEGGDTIYMWNGSTYVVVNQQIDEARFNKLNNKALRLFKRGQLDQAIATWKKIEQQVAPYDIEVLNNIGFAYYQLGKTSKNPSAYSAANNYLIKTLQIEPNRWTALLNAGDLQYDLGKVEASLGYYEKLLKVKPDYKYAVKIRSRIAELKSKVGRTK